jgi:hypothetical protein
MKIRILLLVVMLGIVGRADAELLTSQLLSDCESKREAEQNYCIMYLAGLGDATTIWTAWDEMPRQICPPKGFDTVQWREVFIKHAYEHPEHLQFNAGSVTLAAVQKAFPCK